MIWMAGGLILGVLLNQFAMGIPFVKNYLVDGFFYVGGKLFVKTLKMLVVPLVTFSLISGVLGVGDIRTLGKVGIKSLGLYLITTALAISLGMGLTSIINPGKNFDMQSVETKSFAVKEAPAISEVFINLIPGNPVAAYANGEMLQIIFFTLLFAVCLILYGEKGKKLGDNIEKLNDIMMKMVGLVMSIAPYGVFCLMVRTFANEGVDLLLPMFSYFSCVILALVLHTLITMPFLLKVLSGLNPVVFFKKMRSAQLFAFSTASSNATIPITLRTVEKRLGVEKSVASFTIPFGATINMDGTAIMQGVATVFIANVYGIDLSFFQYLTIIGMAVLASIGTAGVPGVGLIMLAMVFNQVGLPVEGIGLILGVDRLLDMVRTAVNITGDATVTCIVSKWEGKLNTNLFDDPQAGAVEG